MRDRSGTVRRRSPAGHREAENQAGRRAHAPLMARRRRNIPYAPASAFFSGPATAAAISRVSALLADETTNAANRPTWNDDTRVASTATSAGTRARRSGVTSTDTRV